MTGYVVLTTLHHVVRTLDSVGVPCAVMGGMALSAWERVRSTQDVDLLIFLSDEDIPPLIDRLKTAGFTPKRTPALQTLGDIRIPQFLYQPAGSLLEIQVDLLFGNTEYHRTALTRRVRARLAGVAVDVPVLSCEDLILHKLSAGRIEDRADSIALLTENRARLDWAYLRDWVQRLKLQQDWKDILRQAFPDQPSDTVGAESPAPE